MVEASDGADAGKSPIPAHDRPHEQSFLCDLKFGIGLLSFWTVGDSLTMISTGADQRAYQTTEYLVVLLVGARARDLEFLLAAPRDDYVIHESAVVVEVHARRRLQTPRP